MTRLQKLQIEQSEVRSKIGAALDSPEAEREETWQADLDSLTKRAQSLELELRAAISAGDEEVKEEREETSETRELREMVNGADLGNIFDAVIEGRQTDGSERELQSHYGLNTNQIPIVLLEAAGRRWQPGDPRRCHCHGRRNALPGADHRLRLPSGRGVVPWRPPAHGTRRGAVLPCAHHSGHCWHSGQGCGPS